jgi:hypothetical protein
MICRKVTKLKEAEESRIVMWLKKKRVLDIIVNINPIVILSVTIIMLHYRNIQPL